jgi:hypothetical protein
MDQKKNKILILNRIELREIYGGCNRGIFYNLGCNARKAWTSFKDSVSEYMSKNDFNYSKIGSR